MRKSINDTYKPDLIDDDKQRDQELSDLVTEEHENVFYQMR